MNKTEAIETLKRRLDALETEAAALRKIIEAPEPTAKEPLLPDGIAFACIEGPELGKLARNARIAYADAFNTLLDLRRQPGSEAAVDGKAQWYVNYSGVAEYYETLGRKAECISPFFDSPDSALAAKEAVGWDRIKRMMDTLHGRGYEVL